MTPRHLPPDPTHLSIQGEPRPALFESWRHFLRFIAWGIAGWGVVWLWLEGSWR